MSTARMGMGRERGRYGLVREQACDSLHEPSREQEHTGV